MSGYLPEGLTSAELDYIYGSPYPDDNPEENELDAQAQEPEQFELSGNAKGRK